MAQSKSNSDIGQLPFERAIEELESIVKRLEEGKVPLEDRSPFTSAARPSSGVARSCCGRPRPA